MYNNYLNCDPVANKIEHDATTSWSIKAVRNYFNDSKKRWNDYGTANHVIMTFNHEHISSEMAEIAKQSGISTTRHQYVLNQFTKLNTHINKSLFGCQWNRQKFRIYLPLAIACIDYQDTRYWKSLGPLKNMHIHAVVVLRPAYQDRFNQIMSITNMRKFTKNRPVDSVNFWKFEKPWKDTPKTVSYIWKFNKYNVNPIIIEPSYAFHPMNYFEQIATEIKPTETIHPGFMLR